MNRRSLFFNHQLRKTLIFDTRNKNNGFGEVILRKHSQTWSFRVSVAYQTNDCKQNNGFA